MMSHTFKTSMVPLFEWLRYGLAATGFFLAYNPALPIEQSLSILVIFVVFPLAGLTGLESIILAEETALAKGRETKSAYQTQSGMNNLATALTALVVWYWQWGVHAYLTIIFALLFFFSLSAINHSYEFFVSSNRKGIHLMRPILTCTLIAAFLPLISKGINLMH